MDRREAIDILVGVIATNSEEENEALDLAIEALQEPSVSEKESVEGDAESATTTEDCISRQAVTDLLLDAQDGSGQTYEVIRELLHEVAYMPSVPPVKLKNPCDPLLKPDSDECKEQKSKLDCISREDAIEAMRKPGSRMTARSTLARRGSKKRREHWPRGL